MFPTSLFGGEIMFENLPERRDWANTCFSPGTTQFLGLPWFFNFYLPIGKACHEPSRRSLLWILRPSMNSENRSCSLFSGFAIYNHRYHKRLIGKPLFMIHGTQNVNYGFNYDEQFKSVHEYGQQCKLGRPGSSVDPISRSGYSASEESLIIRRLTSRYKLIWLYIRKGRLLLEPSRFCYFVIFACIMQHFFASVSTKIL